MDAKQLCEAWLAGDASNDLASAFKATVAYEAADDIGKACIYRALKQLGTLCHQQQGTRANKRWWHHLDAQFAEGKQGWAQIEMGLRQADEVGPLRLSLAASREKLREAQRDIATLRSTIDGLLVHIRGEAALQQQLQALLKSLTLAQHENQLLKDEIVRLRTDSSRPASIASLQALLKKPGTSSLRKDAASQRFALPNVQSFLVPPAFVDAPPSYPHTPESEPFVALSFGDN